MQLLSALSVLLAGKMSLGAAVPAQPANPSSGSALANVEKRGTLTGHPTISADGIVQSLDWSETNVRDGYIHVDYFISFVANGNVRFHTRFRNANDYFKQKYALVCAIRDAVPDQPAHVFTLSRDGSLSAEKETTSSPQEEDINNPLIAKYWENIVAGDRKMTCEVKGDFDLGELVDKIVKAIAEYGPIIGGVIALF